MDDFCTKCDKQCSRGNNLIVPCNGFYRKRFHRKFGGNLNEHDVKVSKKKKNFWYVCSECTFIAEKLDDKYDDIFYS